MSIKSYSLDLYSLLLSMDYYKYFDAGKKTQQLKNVCYTSTKDWVLQSWYWGIYNLLLLKKYIKDLSF